MKLFIKKCHNFISHHWLKSCIALTCSLTTCCAWADDPVLGGSDLGATAEKLQGIALAWKTALWTFTQVAGIVMGIYGPVLWKKIAQGKSQHSLGTAGSIFICGVIAYFLPYFMGTAGSSLIAF